MKDHEVAQIGLLLVLLGLAGLVLVGAVFVVATVVS